MTATGLRLLEGQAGDAQAAESPAVTRSSGVRPASSPRLRSEAARVIVAAQLSSLAPVAALPGAPFPPMAREVVSPLFSGPSVRYHATRSVPSRPAP